MAIAETRHQIAQTEQIRPLTEGIATGVSKANNTGKTTGDQKLQEASLLEVFGTYSW
jgi:hypothetical protein